MIPARFVTLAEFPLSPSGKIDRHALPAPDAGCPGTHDELPATPTEAVLTRLFATILSTGNISPADNFFESGGNSLQVMRLIDLISSQLGTDLTPASVFLHPTPRQLAAQLETGAPASPAPGPLVPLAIRHRTGPPLTLIHAIAGTVSDYAALAAELADQLTVYGLEAPGLASADPVTPAGPATPAHAGTPSLASLADHYTTIIRAAFPDGPYLLAGWSMGGVLAYEVTRRLEQAGLKVSLLALLDPPYLVPAASQPDRAQLAVQFAAEVLGSLRQRIDNWPNPATESADDLLNWLATRVDADKAQLAGASWSSLATSSCSPAISQPPRLQ